VAQAQAVEKKQMRTPIESGCPDGMQFMHPLMVKNFGNWKYHDRPRPGVMHHVAYSGDEIWTVRVGTQRQLGPYEINLLNCRPSRRNCGGR
jgi:sulfite reductase beta subunit